MMGGRNPSKKLNLLAFLFPPLHTGPPVSLLFIIKWLSQNSWGGQLSSSIIFLSQYKVRDSGDKDGLKKNHLCRL